MEVKSSGITAKCGEIDLPPDFKVVEIATVHIYLKFKKHF